MKISKNDLKQVVKECMLEILQEGLGGQPTKSYKNTEDLYHSKYPEKNVRRTIPTSALKNAVRTEARGDAVLESILSDTAMNTLPRMLENDGRRSNPVHPGLVENVVASADPEDLFGSDVASKWADLAFAQSSRK